MDELKGVGTRLSLVRVLLKLTQSKIDKQLSAKTTMMMMNCSFDYIRIGTGRTRRERETTNVEQPAAETRTMTMDGKLEGACIGAIF